MNIHVVRFRRAEVERRIEELIDLLDTLDDDTDLEPSLGWPEARGLAQVTLVNDDREDDSELLEEGGDTELNGD